MRDDEKFPFTRPEGSEIEMFIQWKGTDVCIDVWCACGWDGHFDGMFMYYWRCPGCGVVWQMGTQVIAKRAAEWDGPVIEPDDLGWGDDIPDASEGVDN